MTCSQFWVSNSSLYLLSFISLRTTAILLTSLPCVQSPSACVSCSPYKTQALVIIFKTQHDNHLVLTKLTLRVEWYVASSAIILTRRSSVHRVVWLPFYNIGRTFVFAHSRENVVLKYCFDKPGLSQKEKQLKYTFIWTLFWIVSRSLFKTPPMLLFILDYSK